jgi:hypothetical protein
MTTTPLDRQLLQCLTDIPEVASSGFSVREGLTGVGVTVLRGRAYFGSWRATGGELIWVSAADGPEEVRCETVDEAVRHTLIAILRSLEINRARRMLTAAAG